MSITSDEYFYIIEGDISPFVRSDLNKKRMWDMTSSFKVKSYLTLLEQHAGRQLLEGPLHLDCTFYLKFKGSLLKGKEYHHRPHMTRPYLSGLLILLEAVGIDVIFKSASSIVSMDTRKYYDTERPRVEFKLLETPRDTNDQT